MVKVPGSSMASVDAHGKRFANQEVVRFLVDVTWHSDMAKHIDLWNIGGLACPSDTHRPTSPLPFRSLLFACAAMWLRLGQGVWGPGVKGRRHFSALPLNRCTAGLACSSIHLVAFTGSRTGSSTICCQLPQGEGGRLEEVQVAANNPTVVGRSPSHLEPRFGGLLASRL